MRLTETIPTYHNMCQRGLVKTSFAAFFLTFINSFFASSHYKELALDSP